jgi:hypothetical protein
MNMKKILQTMNSISTKPVVGADSMARFLRVVKEAELEAVGDPANISDQINAYIRFSSGLYEKSMTNITIKPGLVLPITFTPIPSSGDSFKIIKANVSAANARLPKELQLPPDQLSAIIGGADQAYSGPKSSDPYDGPMAENMQDPNDLVRFLRVIREAEIDQPAAPAPVTSAPPAGTSPGVSLDNAEAFKDSLKKQTGGDPEIDATIDRLVAYDFDGTIDADQTMLNLVKELNELMPKFVEFIKWAIGAMTEFSKTPEFQQATPEDQKSLLDSVRDLQAQLPAMEKQVADMQAQTAREMPGLQQKVDQKANDRFKAKTGMNMVRTGTGAKTNIGTVDYDNPNTNPIQENSLSKFLSIVKKNDVSILNEGNPPAMSGGASDSGNKSGKAYDYQMNALQALLTTESEPWKQNLTKWRIKNLETNGVTAFHTDYNKNAGGVSTPIKVLDSESWLKKNPSLVKRLPPKCLPTVSQAAPVLHEGNPHKVALPVQMAMQHYQQPATKTPPRERLIDKYFVEAETGIVQRKEEKRALINQYAKTIAERVLMKEGADLTGFNTEYLEKAADPNRFGRYLVSIEDAKAELARRVGSQDPNTEPPSKPITTKPTGFSKEYLQSVVDGKHPRPMISIEKAQELLKQMNETPIEMSGDPNDPHIYGHEKANPMSLKGRIGQARAQLKELAQLSESDDLLVWERITQLHKGGMFMGLEQNLEQIRHGIAELAAKRRKGGVASRGIDKHIGEGKRK